MTAVPHGPAERTARERRSPRRQTAAGAPGRRGPVRTRGDWFVLAVAALAALVIAAPFVLILLNSFKSPADYASRGPLALPERLDLTGIRSFWDRVDFPLKLWNSVLISTVVAVGGVTLSVLNAFAIGIGRIRGRTWVVVLFLVATMVPQESLLYPLYYMFKQVGLYDSVWAVIIIFTVIQSAFGTYLLSSVFSTFPKEILEAAALDGAGRWKTLWRVIVPISRPTLAVLALFFFIWTWNEFLIPLTFLVSNDHQTVPIAISSLQGERLTDITTTSASALLGLLPTLLVFLVFQRTLTRGITAGAVK